MYGITKIMEEASPFGIVNYLGIPYRRSGKTTFIACPDHERVLGRPDRHINNCVLMDSFKKAYYCNSCHSSGNGFRLIAGYMNLDIKKDFYKILKMAADSCGWEPAFILNDVNCSTRKPEPEFHPFGLVSDDLKELGLLSGIFSNVYIASYDASQISP